MNTDQPLAPCRSNPRLWESEHIDDHAEAKKSCDNICEIKATCQALLEQTAAQYGLAHGPRGTWAGKLYAEPKKDRRNNEAAA